AHARYYSRPAGGLEPGRNVRYRPRRLSAEQVGLGHGSGHLLSQARRPDRHARGPADAMTLARDTARNRSVGALRESLVPGSSEAQSTPSSPTPATPPRPSTSPRTSTRSGWTARRSPPAACASRPTRPRPRGSARPSATPSPRGTPPT